MLGAGDSVAPTCTFYWKISFANVHGGVRFVCVHFHRSIHVAAASQESANVRHVQGSTRMYFAVLIGATRG
jgi:hypothetical protein